MANLIITIISIALVAVAALMGAYYGGQAYMQASVKARANQIVNGAKQVAAAWQLWALDNASTLYGFPTAEFADTLVPNYLTQIPTVGTDSSAPKGSMTGPNELPYDFRPTVINQGTSRCNTFNVSVCTGSPVTLGMITTVFNTVSYNMYSTDAGWYDLDNKTCLEITKMANGPNATLQSYGSRYSGALGSTLWTKQFDCHRNGATNLYTFYYRVFQIYP
ncbi:MAG TPA: hypothetical protein PKW15_01280 [Alphaproteobacteria bacterium]|nr:hypothetical protein [Rhodospirillaceae bacterium]HRJ11855.1 hypothetical protein [Alphaproteobacteria bacterium]